MNSHSVHKQAILKAIPLFLLMVALTFMINGAVLASSTDNSHAPAATDAAHGETDGHGEEAAHGETGGHGEEGGHGTGWVPTDTYRVMNFAALFIALFLLLRKPVGNFLSGRIDGIKTELSELEAKKAAAEKELSVYQEKLAKLDDEAKQIMAEYVRQGEDAKSRILKEAEASADKLEAQAKRNIESEFKQAKESLHADVMEKALAKAEALIKSKIGTDDQTRLVDEYLEKVVES